LSHKKTGVYFLTSPNMKSAAFSTPLCCHPDFPAPGIAGVSVAGLREEDTLTLDYRIEGDLTLLRLPDSQMLVDANRLWAHTCCEVFWAWDAETGYREYNFSPSGQWATYAFSAYRERQPDMNPPAPRTLSWQRQENSLTLTAHLPVTRPDPLRLALSVVLERQDGKLAYYALAHPPGQPDFHHPSGFVLNLFAESSTS
jgi:hypothetical protein